MSGMCVEDNWESLTEIGTRFGTDKAGAHGYTDYYESLLVHLRRNEVSLLEIGVGGYGDPTSGGESLRMWEEYFPHGRITGVDIFPKVGIAGPRLEVRCGDATDPTFIAEIASESGPWDVIIDDGSHRSKDVVATFHLLFPHLRSGGIYIVEDLQTSYWPMHPSGLSRFGGSHRLRSRRTSMAFFKELADHLNFAEFDVPSFHPSQTDREIEEIVFRHNLVVLRKGSNLTPSNILAPHPIPITHWIWSHTAKRLLLLARAALKRFGA